MRKLDTSCGGYGKYLLISYELKNAYFCHSGEQGRDPEGG